MTITETRPEDTGELRRVVGEETRDLGTIHQPITIRRPDAEPIDQQERRAFALVDVVTGELPIVDGVDAARLRAVPTWTVRPDYRGRHRLTFIRLIGRLLGRKAGAL